MNLLKQIALGWIPYRHFRAVLAKLKQLSDRKLSDRGLARGDIVRVAFEEAERRREATFTRAALGGRAVQEGRLRRGRGDQLGTAGKLIGTVRRSGADIARA